MFGSRVLTLAVLLVLLGTACAPAAATPGPIPTEEPTPITGLALVQTVDVQILDGVPLQVNAVVRGQLPDGGCTTISGIEQVRNGNRIDLTLRTTTDPLAVCTLAIIPFEQVIPLDVAALPASKYVVRANGIEASFKLVTRDVEQFSQLLVDSLNRRSFDMLRVLMNDTVVIAHWQSEGAAYAPEQAIEQLRTSLISSSSTISADPGKDLAALLGTDPAALVGPDLAEVHPLLVSGLGPEGKDQSILFVARAPDGGLYWYGLLFAREGFTPSIPNTGSGQIPVTPQAERPAPETGRIPTISILAVVRNEQVTIRAHDFPANIDFKVRMGRSGTGGVDGFVVDNINSGRGGSFTIAFDIPDSLRGEKQIAIRLESKAGYYSYNWFENTTWGSTPSALDAQPTNVEYIVARQDVSIYAGPSKNYSVIGILREGRTLKVTAVTLDGNWWRVACPDGSAGSCWVSAKPKFTRPSA